MKDKIKDYLVKAKENLLVTALILMAVCFTAGAVTLKILGNNEQLSANGKMLIHIEQGMSTGDIAVMLYEKKLISHPDVFSLEARFKGLAGKLQAGSYEINAGSSNSEIINILASGNIMHLRFTVPEGYTVVKTAHKLEAEGICSAEKFMAAAKDYTPYSYMKTDNPDVIFKAEGFIYPATYDFPAGVKEDEILKTMVKQFDQEMETSGIMQTVKDENLNLRDIVNLAAMVELEAVHADEQPKIAGVFLKRLEIGMPIQSDTTIQYILGVQKEVITFKDTEIQNPYNTYQIMGLPPGPIGSPSLNAIKAVLNPEKTDYLYFVAENNGYHRFSVTYDEHLKAINEIHGEN